MYILIYILITYFLIPSFIKNIAKQTSMKLLCLSFIILASFFSSNMVYRVLKFSQHIHLGWPFSAVSLVINRSLICLHEIAHSLGAVCIIASLGFVDLPYTWLHRRKYIAEEE